MNSSVAMISAASNSFFYESCVKKQGIQDSIALSYYFTQLRVVRAEMVYVWVNGPIRLDS